MSPRQKRYPDIEFVRQTEEEAVCATRSYFGDKELKFRFVVDQLLVLPFFSGTLDDPDSDRGNFQNYCFGHYLQCPFTMLSVYRLWRTAYYLESSILLRHLLEVFVQMRYFDRQPQELIPHLRSKSRKDRVTFKTMFESLSPSSYQPAYGQLLSQFVHGKGNMIFRAQLTRPIPGSSTAIYTPNSGCEFDEAMAILIHIYMSSIALGVLNYHGIFFHDARWRITRSLKKTCLIREYG